ncbi:hydrogen peroxide-inducible genes activator [Stappia sp. ES.058]|uniref:hydrogen peroxide-inducible genes activator n=1 Tax=Stappia sp. ES.058 TaxID=1881061 RepID=UPI00087D5276|nr:hydrogen peroxide-inducible genes activator [Stappia sp. ES.058]SDU27744.1 transcriptional regulator, LysR family [Stappia sp. ES.058]
MLTLRQLRYFDALAHHLHFGRAADAVAVSQPALSMQIRELEATLGIALVERQPNAIRLTEQGREIARRAARILSETRDLLDYGRHAREVLTGSLRLGIIPSIAPYLLPRVLPVLTQAYPNVDLQMRETLTQGLLSELAQGNLDVILAALPLEGNDIETRALFDDRFLLAVRNHPDLDERTRIAPTSIDGSTLLLLEEGHCLRDQALNYCEGVRPEGRSTFGATSLSTVMQMVAAGYGVTLLPELCASVEVRDDRVSLLRFTDPQPQRSVGLAWRRSSPRRQDFDALGDCILDALERPLAIPRIPDTAEAGILTL